MVCVVMSGQRIRPVATIMADFIHDRYRGGIGPGFFDLFDFVAAGNRTYINALGHVVTAGVNEPRTGHHAYDVALGQWMPVGLLLEPDGQNGLKHSENLIHPDWSTGNDATVTASGTIAGIPAFEVADNSATYGQISQGGHAWTGIRTLSVRVDKDTSSTSLFGYRVQFGSQFCGVSFHVETGGINNQWNDGLLGRGVIDQGDHWIAWFTYDSDAIVAAAIQVFPAHNNLGYATGGTYTGKHRITAIQSEPGFIPGGSSYIKTEGSPLSRAKDSLEISALTIAKLLVKHNRAPELVENGNGSDGVTGWLGDGDTAISSANGRIRATLTGTDNPRGFQEVSGLTIGATYLLGGTTHKNSSGGVFLRVASDSAFGGGDVVNSSVDDAESHAELFVATATTLYAGSVLVSSTQGEFVELSGLSIKEVTMPTRYGPQLANPGTQTLNVATGAPNGAGYDLIATGDRMGVRQDGLTVGKIYEVTFGWASNDGAATYINGFQDIFGFPGNNVESGTHTITGKAIETYALVNFATTTPGDEKYAEITSVREVIQDLTLFMKGLMAYADQDAPEEAIFFNWGAFNSNDWLGVALDARFGSGAVRVQQREAGNNIEIFSGGSIYAPGNSVPLQIASYHRNTGLNGATQVGVLAEGTTVTELPDLVGVPIQIAQKGSITLSNFSLFLGASGDDLLAELVR